MIVISATWVAACVAYAGGVLVGWYVRGRVERSRRRKDQREGSP
jgi:hypothetical protein